ncbi:hypothetical protein C8R45DRAFT_577493 [Mycena sanguinolenta]|nr:hypothetical protein C8R45DRAFT_577493 [Mycena sanguinolenta]
MHVNRDLFRNQPTSVEGWKSDRACYKFRERTISQQVGFRYIGRLWFLIVAGNMNAANNAARPTAKLSSLRILFCFASTIFPAAGDFFAILAGRGRCRPPTDRTTSLRKRIIITATTPAKFSSNISFDTAAGVLVVLRPDLIVNPKTSWQICHVFGDSPPRKLAFPLFYLWRIFSTL